MNKKKLRTQLTSATEDLNPAELKDYQKTTRRFAAWNRRAALLRALEANPTEEENAFLNAKIRDLENAFQIAAWEIAGDDAAGLDSITPLPGAQGLAALAKANKDAAQAVATATLVRDFVVLGTKFLNIANGAIPA